MADDTDPRAGAAAAEPEALALTKTLSMPNPAMRIKSDTSTAGMDASDAGRRKMKRSSSDTESSSVVDVLKNHFACMICLDWMVAAHSLSCGHLFCGCCLAKWLNMNQSCPSCRKAIAGADSLREEGGGGRGVRTTTTRTRALAFDADPIPHYPSCASRLLSPPQVSRCARSRWMPPSVICWRGASRSCRPRLGRSAARGSAIGRSSRMMWCPAGPSTSTSAERRRLGRQRGTMLASWQCRQCKPRLRAVASDEQR
jgi:hypothetical protein